MIYRSLIGSFVLLLASVAGTLWAQSISPDSILISPAHNEVLTTIPVTFGWHSVPLANLYSIRISSDSLSLERVANNWTSDTFITISSLPSDSALWWKISAINYPDTNTIDTIAISTARRFHTTKTYPAILVSPVHDSVELDTISTLTWRSDSLCGSYILELSQTPIYVSVLTDTLSDTTRIVEGLSPHTVHYWRVKPLRSDSLGVWSKHRKFTTRLVPATQVTLATPKDSAIFPVIDTNTTFRNFTWISQFAASNYHLQVAYSPSFDAPILDDSAVKKFEFTTKLFFENATYYWRVRAYNELGWGEWSETRQFRHSIFNSVDIGDEDDIVVFPNPAIHLVTVRGISLSSGASLELVNILGEVLKREDMVFGNTEAILSLDEIPPGMYYLLIKMNDGKYKMAKVIK